MSGAPFHPTPEELAELARRKRASLGQLLFRAARRLNEQAVARVQAAGARGVRLGHTALLPHIDFGGTRLTDLAERAGVTKQAVGQMVEELEGLGVVRRLPDPEDGRVRRVHFTRKGFGALLQGLEVLGALEDEVAARLGRREAAALKDGLAALVAALEDGEP